MTVIEELIMKVKSAEESTDELILDLVKDREELVISLNVDDQLYNGLDANGEVVAPEYAQSTINRKKKKGHPYNRVTLKDSGDFHSSFMVDYRTNEFVIEGGDRKKEYLVRKYGEDIFGLTEKNISRLSAEIRDDFVSGIKKIILQQ